MQLPAGACLCNVLVTLTTLLHISAQSEDDQDVMRRSATGYRLSGLGKRDGRDSNGESNDIWRRAANFRYAGLGKRGGEAEYFDSDEDRYELHPGYLGDPAYPLDKRSLAYKYSGLGKRFEMDQSKRSAGFKYSGLGKRGSENSEELTHLRDTLQQALQYDTNKRAAAGFRYAGLGKRDSVEPYFDDFEFSKRGSSNYKYSGLGKRLKNTFQLTGLGKRSSAYRLTGLGKRSDDATKRQTAFRYAGLGKRSYGMQYTGLGKRSDSLAMLYPEQYAQIFASSFPTDSFESDSSANSDDAAQFMHTSLEKRSVNSAENAS